MSGVEALRLYRNILKEASKILDYNLNAYIIRRTGERFRQNRSISDPKTIEAFLAEAKNEYEVICRQRIVQNLYFNRRNILQQKE